MEKKEKRQGMLERTSDLLGVPGDLAAGVFRVTVTGYRKVLIENHRGILEYGSESIRVNCGKTIVRITGSGLEVRTISSAEMLITGIVDEVGFEK